MRLNPFFVLRASTAVVAGLLCQAALALAPFAVRDIRIEGLQRVEAGTVFASIPVRVGDTYSDEKAAASIRALFALGLFKDVRIDARDGVLVVVVEERPTIADVDFPAPKNLTKTFLRKLCAKSGWPMGGLRQGTCGPRRTGTKAAIHFKKHVCDRSCYHGDAD